MKGWLLLATAFFLWPGCSSQNEITCNSPRILNGSFRPQRTIYNDGDLIRIQCDTGFTFEPDNGEKVVECTKNGWSPSLKCVKITCQADYIENGNILSPKSTYKEGERIRFSCNEGYTFVDRPDALCTENGWGSKLQCKEIQCFPPEVTNGSFRPRRAQYTYNDEIETICDEGFVFGGPGKTSICTVHGWNPPAVCKRKGCDYIRIENGRMTDYLEWYKPFPLWQAQTIQFYCYRGFLPASKQNTWQTATCINSRYVPELKCFKTCNPSLRFNNGQFTNTNGNTYIEGDNITFVCDKGYSPANQQSTVTCTKKGWSPPPRCVLPE